jgi:hypothetical protein
MQRLDQMDGCYNLTGQCRECGRGRQNAPKWREGRRQAGGQARSRRYAASIGHFVSIDPFSFSPSSPPLPPIMARLGLQQSTRSTRSVPSFLPAMICPTSIFVQGSHFASWMFITAVRDERIK